MDWMLAKRRTTWGRTGQYYETPYLMLGKEAELDFSFDSFSRARFTYRCNGRDFEFAPEQDHDFPPLVQKLAGHSEKIALPLVLGPDCLVRVWPKRETRRSWTAEVVAHAASGIKSALRALHRIAPEFCSNAIERIRFGHADEFIVHSDYPEKIRPGNTPVWYMKCAGQHDWYPKINWTSDPPVDSWTSDILAAGKALPRFVMAGESPMPDFFNIPAIGSDRRLPVYFDKMVSSRARELIEAVAPGELSYRSLSVEMSSDMKPAEGYFLIQSTRKSPSSNLLSPMNQL